MHTTLRRTAILSIAALILFNSLLVKTPIAFASNIGGKLDLFTQQDPYSGRGSNVSSDAFAPGDNVVIYALLTYNSYPVVNWLVSFGVIGPLNPVANVTLSYSAMTNSEGIAQISFRIPALKEASFGEWTVLGNSYITAGTDLKDVVTFNVDWIVEIVSVKTMNGDHVLQSEFAKGSQVGVEISLKNIAMTEKTITLTATILDSMSFYVDSKEIDNLAVPATETLVYVPLFLNVSRTAEQGIAVVNINAYTAPLTSGGSAFCPQVSANFEIVEHDIAVLAVKTSSNRVFKGETVNVDVTIGNNAGESESFTVKLHANETLIGTACIQDLLPFSNATQRFVWSTDSLADGSYSISASATPVPGEIDLSNNVLVDGFVNVKTRLHDLAVLTVAPSASMVYIGDIVTVNVTVQNRGDQAESFGVLLSYDNSVIATLYVNALSEGTEYTLTFNWNTIKVPEGNYTLIAYAEPVTGETNTADNTFAYGTVRIVAPPTRYIALEWFNWALLLLLILLVILLLLWFFVNRRKKNNEETFYSGWTAWYYSYDLRNKPRTNDASLKTR